MKKISFPELIKEIKVPWEPRDILFINDTAVRIAQINGAFDWHVHQDEDELFLVLRGKIFIDTEDDSIELNEKEAFLVKKGVRHRSRSDAPAWILLFEPKKTKTKGEQV